MNYYNGTCDCGYILISLISGIAVSFGTLLTLGAI